MAKKDPTLRADDYFVDRAAYTFQLYAVPHGLKEQWAAYRALTTDARVPDYAIQLPELIQDLIPDTLTQDERNRIDYPDGFTVHTLPGTEYDCVVPDGYTAQWEEFVAAYEVGEILPYYIGFVNLNRVVTALIAARDAPTRHDRLAELEAQYPVAAQTTGREDFDELQAQELLPQFVTVSAHGEYNYIRAWSTAGKAEEYLHTVVFDDIWAERPIGVADLDTGTITMCNPTCDLGIDPATAGPITPDTDTNTKEASNG